MFGGTIIGDLNTRQHLCQLKLEEFPCLRCGTCCAKFQPHLTLSEARDIADKLGVSWENFLEKYTDHRWPGTRSILIRHRDRACIFLTDSSDKKQRLCLIHNFKPACCRDWHSGPERPECREGLKTKWGLTVDAAGHIAGDGPGLKAFEKFIQSLK